MSDGDDLDRMRFVLTLRSRGVTDPRVLAAMERIDRGLFVRGLGGEAWDLTQPKYQQVHMGAVADQLAVNAQYVFGGGK